MAVLKLPDGTELLAIKTAAERFGVSRNLLLRGVQKGLLPTVKVGNLRMVTAESVKAFLALHYHRRKAQAAKARWARQKAVTRDAGN